MWFSTAIGMGSVGNHVVVSYQKDILTPISGGTGILVATTMFFHKALCSST